VQRRGFVDGNLDFKFRQEGLLTVDDNGDAADAIQMLLIQFGHDAFANYSGSHALASLEESVLRAVIIDLSMPVMDGF